jgi:hypothetical protein
MFAPKGTKKKAPTRKLGERWLKHDIQYRTDKDGNKYMRDVSSCGTTDWIRV